MGQIPNDHTGLTEAIGHGTLQEGASWAGGCILEDISIDFPST